MCLKANVESLQAIFACLIMSRNACARNLQESADRFRNNSVSSTKGECYVRRLRRIDV